MSQQIPTSPEMRSTNEAIEKLKTFSTPEEKISFGLQYMRESISQEGAPRFRDFWETRTTLLPYFKQNVNPAIRSQLWAEYVELTVEARRLKDLFEEQSAFAAEQIDLAIQALEQDLTNFETLINQTSLLQFPSETRFIYQKADIYNLLQRELNLLNTLASRLNCLRQEIIKTEMRIRNKTKFFKRLTELGDQIFPKRKQLIEQVSNEFSRDIEQFIQRHFPGDAPVGAPYYVLRDEIKALQAWAKLLTLDVNTFTKVRTSLSECWDKIKASEKLYKQAFLQKKQVWTENRTTLEARIAKVRGRNLTDPAELNQAIAEIEKEISSQELGREDLAFLKKELTDLRAPIIEAEKQKQLEQERLEQEKITLRKQKSNDLKDRISSLLKDTEKTYEQLTKEIDEIHKEVSEVVQGKFEEQQFERLLRPLRDLILERKEQMLLSLSDDERNTLNDLREALKERKRARSEIKEQIESYRKSLAGSNLDFEKAIALQEQIELEKERMQKANASILEIEQKISQIEDLL